MLISTKSQVIIVTGLFLGEEETRSRIKKCIVKGL